MQTAANVIRKAREKAGLSQAALAALAGTRQSAISAYEGGKREPGLATLERLLKAAGQRMTIGISTDPGEETKLPATVVGMRLEGFREQIRKVVARHGGSNPRIFGSVARGENDSESDVDILVDLPERTGFLAIGMLAQELEALVGVDFDIVPSSSLSAATIERLSADAVRL